MFQKVVLPALFVLALVIGFLPTPATAAGRPSPASPDLVEAKVRVKPRATIAANRVALASGKVRVQVSSNAKKVKLTYRTNKNKKRSKNVKLHKGSATATLSKGTQSIYVQALATKKLRRSLKLLVKAPSPTRPLTGVGPIIRLSTTAGGGQSNGTSGAIVFSRDGSKIAFTSDASNLVSEDTNGHMDVFVKTLATGAIVRVSTSAKGVEADGDSSHPAFSPDGSKVAFSSMATNLVGGDSNGEADIYVKTLASQAIVRVSTTAAEKQADSRSVEPAFSPDGTRVAFTSHATNLVAGDTNSGDDVFVKTLATHAITRVSTDGSGKQADGRSSNPVFSPDGAKIAFESTSSNLVRTDTNAHTDIFVKTLATRKITRISTTATGAQANRESFDPTFSPDGRKVAFASQATNLVREDNNGKLDIFVKTVATGAVDLISVSASGKPGNARSFGPAVFSPDGTRITFASNASTLVRDTNLKMDVFVKTLATKAVARVSTDTHGQAADGHSSGPVFSPDGRKVAFSSAASNLVKDTNGQSDVFLKTLTSNPFYPEPPGAPIDVQATARNGVAARDGGAQVSWSTPPNDGGSTITKYQVVAAPGGAACTTAGPRSCAIKGLTNGSPYTFRVRATNVAGTGPFSASSAAVTPVRVPTTGAEPIVRVSTNRLGQETGGGERAVFSPDGKKIAFESWAGDLVEGDSNFSTDAFVKTLATNEIVRVSTDSAGRQASGSRPVFSPDGTKIAFESDSSKLVEGDTDFSTDVFVKTLATGKVERVSTDSAGRQASGSRPVFSPDGTKIAFESSATNLVADDTNGSSDIFVKTLATGKVERLSTTPNGGQANSSSEQLVFSRDGTKIAFTSTATNLVPADDDFRSDLFVKTLATGNIVRIPLNTIGAEPAAFSPDGAKIAFSTYLPLVNDDTNGTFDGYVQTLTNGRVERVTTDAAGGQSNAYSRTPVFSPDGSRIVFESFATNLVPGEDLNGTSPDIFVKTLATGKVVRASADAEGKQGDDASQRPEFSPDGRRVAFDSDATNLVPGDTRGARDVFVKTLP